jgi:tRNA wybutosine-synthesizing protein 1
MKRQRTVYRLTLVKEWNTDELKGYADLVSIGHPDFIEVKGVTYCGESKASNLTMSNVPWHHEVLKFVRTLADMLPDYELVCEHEHSNCTLIAHKKFLINGLWHTWIDYPKFHQLMKVYNDTEGVKTFTALDYTSATPGWSLIGSIERGFDPQETRWIRRNKKKQDNDDTGC